MDGDEAALESLSLIRPGVGRGDCWLGDVRKEEAGDKNARGTGGAEAGNTKRSSMCTGKPLAWAPLRLGELTARVRRLTKLGLLADN